MANPLNMVAYRAYIDCVMEEGHHCLYWLHTLNLQLTESGRRRPAFQWELFSVQFGRPSWLLSLDMTLLVFRFRDVRRNGGSDLYEVKPTGTEIPEGLDSAWVWNRPEAYTRVSGDLDFFPLELGHPWTYGLQHMDGEVTQYGRNRLSPGEGVIDTHLIRETVEAEFARVAESLVAGRPEPKLRVRRKGESVPVLYVTE